MIRIGIVGLPSTGKTALAAAVAAYINEELGIRADLIQEYAREYLEEHGVDTSWDQSYIFNTQCSREEAAEGPVLVTDSPIHLNYAYMFDSDEGTSRSGMLLSDAFKKLLELNRIGWHYELLIYLPDVLPVEKDNVRQSFVFSPFWRENMNNLQHALGVLFPGFDEIDVPETLLTLEERLAYCKPSIKESVMKAVEH